MLLLSPTHSLPNNSFLGVLCFLCSFVFFVTGRVCVKEAVLDFTESQIELWLEASTLYELEPFKGSVGIIGEN